MSKEYFTKERHNLDRLWKCPECTAKLRNIRNDSTPVRRLDLALLNDSESCLSITKNQEDDISINAFNMNRKSDKSTNFNVSEFENVTIRNKSKSKSSAMATVTVPIDPTTPLTITENSVLPPDTEYNINKEILRELLLFKKDITSLLSENEQRFHALEQYIELLKFEIVAMHNKYDLLSRQLCKVEVENAVEVQHTTPAIETRQPQQFLPNESPVCQRKAKPKPKQSHHNKPAEQHTAGCSTPIPEQRNENSSDNIPEQVENQTPIMDKNNDDHEWTLVSGRKKKQTHSAKPQILRGQNAQIRSIQGIHKKKHLHVWSLRPDTTTETISNYVKSVCNSNDITVDKIQPKVERAYSSFRIGVPEQLFDKVFCVDIWPINAQISEWVWFRNFRKRQTPQA